MFVCARILVCSYKVPGFLDDGFAGAPRCLPGGASRGRYAIRCGLASLWFGTCEHQGALGKTARMYMTSLTRPRRTILYSAFLSPFFLR